MLRLFLLLGIPSAGLQTAFAQQGFDCARLSASCAKIRVKPRLNPALSRSKKPISYQ